MGLKIMLMKIGYQQTFLQEDDSITSQKCHAAHGAQQKTPTPGVTCSTLYNRNDAPHSKCSIANLIPRGCLKLMSSITNTQQSWRCILTPRHMFMGNVEKHKITGSKDGKLGNPHGPSRKDKAFNKCFVVPILCMSFFFLKKISDPPNTISVFGGQFQKSFFAHKKHPVSRWLFLAQKPSNRRTSSPSVQSTLWVHDQP